MSTNIQVAAQPGRPTAARAAATTWQELPGRWRGMLDEVRACPRQAAGAPS
jgi:hypothetical protein